MKPSSFTARRAIGAGLVALSLAAGTAACSTGSSGSGGKSASSGTYTLWDPYAQFDNGSAWVKLLDSCGSKAGVSMMSNGAGQRRMKHVVRIAGLNRSRGY